MPHRRYFFKLKSPDIKLPTKIGFEDSDVNKGNHEDRFHIHMAKINSDFWRDQLLFRNYLREHSEARKEYESVKESLAKLEWDSINDYAEAKSDYVTAVLEKAESRKI